MSRLTRTALIVAAGTATAVPVVLAILHGCAGCTSGAVPADAGPIDLGGVDAGTDAAPLDADRVDASADAGGDPNWATLPGVSADCRVYIARDPMSLLGPIHFEPCPDRAACRRIAIDWPPVGAFSFLLTVGQSRPVHDGTHGYFAIVRGWPVDDDLQMIVRDDGVVLVAVRTPQATAVPDGGCSAAGLTYGDGRFAFSVRTHLPPYGGPVTLFGGDVADLRSLRGIATLSPTDLHGNDPDYMSVNASEILMEWLPGNLLIRMGWDGAWTVVSPPGIRGDLDDLVGTVGYFSTLEIPSRIMQASGTSVAIPFVTQSPDGGIPSSMGTDGHDLVWMQGINQRDAIRFDSVDVVTAAYTEIPAALAPRHVASHPSVFASRPAVGFGHALVGDEPTQYLYRLSDGHRVDLTAAAGEYWDLELRYVGPTEILLASGPAGVNVPHVEFITYAPLEP